MQALTVTSNRSLCGVYSMSWNSVCESTATRATWLSAPAKKRTGSSADSSLSAAFTGDGVRCVLREVLLLSRCFLDLSAGCQPELVGRPSEPLHKRARAGQRRRSTGSKKNRDDQPTS